MDKNFALKLIGLVGILFLGYLWIGGIYTYGEMGSQKVRTNKVTGTIEYLGFDLATNAYVWRNITETIPTEDYVHEEESAPVSKEATASVNSLE
jgi:hypothetical protein